MHQTLFSFFVLVVAGHDGQMGINVDLARGAIDMRDKMQDKMRAGENGDI